MKRAPGTFGTVTISSSPFGSAASAVAGEVTPTMVQSRVTSSTPSVARRTAARRGDSTWVMSVLFISASISVGLPCGAGFGFGSDGAGAGSFGRPPVPRYRPRGQWLNSLLRLSLPAPLQSETRLWQWSPVRPQLQTGGAPLRSTTQPATRRRPQHSSPTLLQVLTRGQRRRPPVPLQTQIPCCRQLPSVPLQARIPRPRRLQSLARLYLPTRRQRQQRCLAPPQLQIGGRPTQSTTRPAARHQPVQRSPQLLLAQARRRRQRPPGLLQAPTRRRRQRPPGLLQAPTRRRRQRPPGLLQAPTRR